ncbi:MFS transporter [Motilimonas sp. 1_MG-2023]|uniref:MFS transporter n=1 Tax=Motilimonas sp. 1_MG-2023 TaxID=3062672 RepID=UPI0026E2BB12|nr:MFS transporter [Motilimonas sp. 1_MG-2023]MDO6527737.1 MFS transporter [Motilimonas sp. 1_MG-2023]
MRSRLPSGVYLLSLGIFIMISCELQVLGFMPELAADLGVTIAEVGYLVSAFAASMAIGGPILMLILSRFAPRTILVCLYVIFLLGELFGALAQNYSQLMVARAITGMVAGAFFGVSIGLCSRMTAPQDTLRAVALVLAGIMLGTIIGLPLAKVVAEQWSWRESFYLVVAFGTISALITLKAIPSLPAEAPHPIKQELKGVLDRRLWWVFATSFCVIGAVYAPFSFIVPLLTDLAGLPENAVTWLLFAYGVCMLAGNHVVAMLAVKHAKVTLISGLLILIGTFSVFALFVESSWVAVTCLIVMGFCGISLNPALVSRLMELPQGQRAFINTLHASVINVGIMFGSFVAGLMLDIGYSLHSVIWTGAAVALAGLAVLGLSPKLSGADTGEAPLQPEQIQPKQRCKHLAHGENPAG